MLSWFYKGQSSDVFEVEIPSSKLFKDLGVLVVEGRIPEISKNGRKAGVHSWPLSRNSMKHCCFGSRNKEICEVVSLTRTSINLLLPTQKIYINVYAILEKLDPSHRQKDSSRINVGKTVKTSSILSERWTMELKSKSDTNENVNVNMVLQAVRSFLHFSQLCSWWAGCSGACPSAVNYKFTCEEEGDFIITPVTHSFPSTEISKTENIEVMVHSLPRMTISELSFMIKQNKNKLTFDGGGRKICQNLDISANSIDTYNSCMTSKSNKLLFSKENICTASTSSSCSDRVKRKDNEIDKYFSNHLRTSNCQSTSYVGEKLLKLDDERWREPSKILDDLSDVNKSFVENSSPTSLSLSALLEQYPDKPYSPSTSSSSWSANTNMKLENLLQDFVIGTSSNSQVFSSDEEDDNEEERTKNADDNKSQCSSDYLFSSDNKITPPRFVSTENCTTSQDNPPLQRMRSKSASPQFTKHMDENHNVKMKSKPIAARRLAMVAGTEPIFNPKTGLPMSSSPAPIKKLRKISDCSCGSSLSRSGSYDDLKPIAYGLSKSAPPSMLLGNFEESVLKGRIPVNGTIEGFKAELGASGTFCTKHVTFPVKVQHFNLSDDNTPSPYLGLINLRSKKTKHKRYRVPKRGTIQLTIFNPNNTVVKVFVVLYNLDDMPPLSCTFLRQRMVSARPRMMSAGNNSKSYTDVQVVHYLVHLSFMSSQKSHIYLHSDIRILFPQQTPDRPLLTITESPTDPKYTLIPPRQNRRKEQTFNEEV